MNVSSRTILKILSLTSLFIGGLALAWLARRELAWIGIAVFLAIALNPAVERLTRWMPRRRRSLAIGSVFVLLFAVVALLLVSFVPPLIQQSQLLVRNLPGYTDQLIHGHSWLSQQVQAYHLADRLKQSQDQLVHYTTMAGTQFLAVMQSAFSSLVASFTVLGLTFFMLLEGPGWLAAFWRAVPAKKRSRAQRLVGQMYKAVTGYVNGNLATSLIAAAATSLMLAIVGVPYAIPLGILVGIMDLLPLVGATIGALIVLVVALFTSFTAVLVMLVFFAIYQQVENHALQPLVYGRTVEVSPLVVLVAVLMGAAAGGIMGAIVAIPLFASLQILIRDYAERHGMKP